MGEYASVVLAAPSTERYTVITRPLPSRVVLSVVLLSAISAGLSGVIKLFTFRADIISARALGKPGSVEESIPVSAENQKARGGFL